MIMTLLSLLGGGIMRLLPEVFSILNKKTDYVHELAMLDRQAELEKTRESSRRETIMVQGDISETLALLDAQKSALAGQFQKTGFRVVDALNFLVRPLTTYFFLLMYGTVKVATLAVALQTMDPWVAILQCWSQDDATTLAGILGFYFVGRSFDKKP
jgi:hypothetical protein